MWAHLEVSEGSGTCTNPWQTAPRPNGRQSPFKHQPVQGRQGPKVGSGLRGGRSVPFSCCSDFHLLKLQPALVLETVLGPLSRDSVAFVTMARVLGFLMLPCPGADVKNMAWHTQVELTHTARLRSNQVLDHLGTWRPVLRDRIMWFGRTKAVSNRLLDREASSTAPAQVRLGQAEPSGSGRLCGHGAMHGLRLLAHGTRRLAQRGVKGCCEQRAD